MPRCPVKRAMEHAGGLKTGRGACEPYQRDNGGLPRFRQALHNETGGRDKGRRVCAEKQQ